MTREEALNITDEQAIEHLQKSGWMQRHDKALSEPYLCEDCISREKALKKIDEYIEEYDETDIEGLHPAKWCAMQEARLVLEKLPSVQPTIKPCEDCKRTEDVLKILYKHGDVDIPLGVMLNIEDDIKNLPSVQPTRPHGEWKAKYYGGRKLCTNCGAFNNSKYKNFCPNCGVDMRGDNND